MKAIIRETYGSPEVLRLAEVEKPTAADDELLIRVHAASVNLSDWEGLTGKPLYARIGGFRKPSAPILGSDVAGRVEAVGAKVTRFKPGDEIFALMWSYHGGFAEYACPREKDAALKPAGLTFEQAATIPQAGAIALQGIRDKGQVRFGQKVLINGAGGGAGSFAIQLAKLHGAEVTGVDNTGKLDFMRSLGADYVIDHTSQDFTRTGVQYDMILDVVAHRSVFAYRRALQRDGSYFMVGGSVPTLLQILLLGPWIKRATGRSIRMLIVQPNPEDMLHIAELASSGKLLPVIDKTYPLSEVPQALRYLGEGHSRGKIVISLEPDFNA